MPNASPILLTLHKFLQHGLQRLSSNSSGTGQRSSFHDWCHAAQPQQTCHTALELYEVLIQVFKHLDSRTLTTTIPLVCQHWKAAAASDQIWKPRCDPQLLASVQQQTPGLQLLTHPSVFHQMLPAQPLPHSAHTQQQSAAALQGPATPRPLQ
jgi:hypothetical protein